MCDRSEDIECLKSGSNALNGQSDQQLYDLTQKNLLTGEDMVLKRAAIAKQSGLPCYDQFYQKYTKGLEAIFLGSNETKRLDGADSPQERSDAIKAIAGITQAVICDEKWRAVHFNDTIKEAECSALESTVVLDLVHFKPKLAALESGLFFGSLASKLKNKVMSGVLSEVCLHTSVVIN